MCVCVCVCVFCAICTQMRAFNSQCIVVHTINPTFGDVEFPLAEDPRWRSNFNQHDTGGCDLQSLKRTCG